MSEIEELIAHLETQKTTPTVDRLISKVKEQDREIERLEKLYHKATEEISRAERYKGLERIRAEKAEAEAGQQRHLAKQNIMRARKVEARIKELEQEVLWAADACEKAEAGLVDAKKVYEAHASEAERQIDELQEQREKLVEALGWIKSQPQECQRIMAKHGWKYEDSEDFEQKMTFTMYSRVVECAAKAEAVLAEVEEKA